MALLGGGSHLKCIVEQHKTRLVCIKPELFGDSQIVRCGVVNRAYASNPSCMVNLELESLTCLVVRIL